MSDIVNLGAHYIGAPASGINLYQIPNASMQVLGDIINATWNLGLQKSTEVSSKVANATTGYLDLLDAPSVAAGAVSVANIVEPNVTIPESIDADWKADFDDKYVEIGTWLAGQFASFKSANFPDDSAALSATISRLTALASTTIDDVVASSVSAPGISGSVVAQPVSGNVSALSVTSGSISSPSVSEPSIFIPSSVDTSDILDMFNSTYLELVALLETKFGAYRATYFANEGTVYDSAEDWLLAALANTSVAMPAAIAEQIVEDDRSRILADKVRAQDAVVAQFAARGFPLPPDVAANAVLQIEQKAQDEIAESSRKVAILSIDLTQKTLDRALKLRTDAMQAANEYIKALASGPDMASRMVNIGYDAQSKLISAVASLLGARAEVAKLSIQAQTSSVGFALDAAKSNQSASIEADKANLGAVVEHAKLTLEAGRANLGAAIEEAKLSVDADKFSVQIAFEAAKANQVAALESVKVALTTTVDLRTKSMQSCVDYLRALALAPDVASRLVGIGYDAQSKLISSAASFFNSRISAAEAINKANQYNNTLTFEADRANQNVEVNMIENKLKALLTEIQAIAQQTTALFNNLHVSASISANGGTMVSTSSEV